MELGLKGKVAFVTGAGSQIGFGKGMALALAEEGCDIIVTDIDLNGAQKTAEQVKALGREALAIKTDVADRKEVNNAVREAMAKFGKIDILVNNAGVASGVRPFVQSTEEEWEQDTNINYKGALYCTHAILPQMIERKDGKIINISSVCALSVPDIGVATYCTAKAAVLHFSKILAAEVQSLGINVNVICPDFGDTDFHRASKTPPTLAKPVKEAAEAGKTVTLQDIGNVAVFLASNVSRKINGQVIKMGLSTSV